MLPEGERKPGSGGLAAAAVPDAAAARPASATSRSERRSTTSTLLLSDQETASGALAPLGCRAMCFDRDSLPPIPVISGAAISHDDLVLEASDGNRFAGFAASPDEPAKTGVVILPDVRGLYRFYEEVALRFAERGYAAVAFDYFGRTAGVGKRGDDFDYTYEVEQTTPEGVQADVAAAVAWLRECGVE